VDPTLLPAPTDSPVTSNAANRPLGVAEEESDLASEASTLRVYGAIARAVEDAARLVVPALRAGGLTWAEIADIFGFSVAETKRRLQAAEAGKLGEGERSRSRRRDRR
jgi:DNA-directed RNA polymerase specialized sigma24 family protein